MSDVMYEMGTKPYNPKAQHNVETWSRIQKVLKKGPVTLAKLREACQYEVEVDGKKKAVNHTNFIGYMERGHHIVRVNK